MTPSIAAAQLANIVCTGKGASNNANRPSTTTSHGDSSKTLDNQIKAPPRAAIARDRSNDRDGFHQSEPQDNLPLLLENNDGADMTENNINPSEELKTTGSSKSPTESEADTAGRRGASSARWGSRTVGITSPRRARASLSPKETIHSMDPKSRGATEGRALGVAALAKLTGHGPAGKAGSKTSPTLQEDEPKKSPQQSVSSAENSQISVEEQQKLSAELEQLKDLAQIQEAELKALRAEQRKDRETSERQLREISHHEAKLASEIRDKTFWSKKHEEVHRQYLKTESEYRILQATVADRDGMWKREWERKNEHLLQERDRCRDGFHAAQRTSQERDEEARELRRQVLELKHSISTSTRTEAQVTDDVFREKVRVLGHDLQNWTITNFRKKDLGVFLYQLRPCSTSLTRLTLDMSNLFDSVRDELSSIVPFYATLASKSRLNVIQSFVSGMLVQEVFRVYYFGLSPDRVSQLRNMEEYLLTVGRSSLPGSRVYMSNWTDMSNRITSICESVALTDPSAPETQLGRIVKGTDI